MVGLFHNQYKNVSSSATWSGSGANLILPHVSEWRFIDK
jgi:hypothetical protein